MRVYALSTVQLVYGVCLCENLYHLLYISLQPKISPLSSKHINMVTSHHGWWKYWHIQPLCLWMELMKKCEPTVVALGNPRAQILFSYLSLGFVRTHSPNRIFISETWVTISFPRGYFGPQTNAYCLSWLILME